LGLQIGDAITSIDDVLLNTHNYIAMRNILSAGIECNLNAKRRTKEKHQIMPSDDDIKCQLDIPGKYRSLIKRAKLIFTPAFGVKTSSMDRKISLAIKTNDIIDFTACFFRHYQSIGGTHRHKFSGRPSTIVIQYFSTLLPYRRR
jgi:hypothetical protein